MWCVYVMAAPAANGLTYFKIGITSSIAKRIGAVQTGCPLKISRVWAINTLSNGAAQALESSLHERLRAYHSHGEWFEMATENMEHKRAMNAAFAYAVDCCGGPERAKWRALGVDELRQAIRDLRDEKAKEERASRRRVRDRMLVKMVTEKRRIL